MNKALCDIIKCDFSGLCVFYAAMCVFFFFFEPTSKVRQGWALFIHGELTDMSGQKFSLRLENTGGVNLKPESYKRQLHSESEEAEARGEELKKQQPVPAAKASGNHTLGLVVCK